MKRFHGRWEISKLRKLQITSYMSRVILGGDKAKGYTKNWSSYNEDESATTDYNGAFPNDNGHNWLWTLWGLSVRSKWIEVRNMLQLNEDVRVIHILFAILWGSKPIW